jgi:hypothetical protein
LTARWTAGCAALRVDVGVKGVAVLEEPAARLDAADGLRPVAGAAHLPVQQPPHGRFNFVGAAPLAGVREADQ